MHKKILYILSIIFFVSSCGDSLKQVKRGITGEKQITTDEFLVEKKDPLILPPDFEDLPSPDEKATAIEEIDIFEKTIETSVENNTSSTNSVEESILKKIRSK